MNRRNFLKACGMTAAVVAAPNLAFANQIEDVIPEGIDYSQFDPTERYGNSVMVTGTSDDLIKKAISVLEENMVKVIPPTYRKKVEYIVQKGHYDYGHLTGVGWKYSPVPKTPICITGGRLSLQ